jgi:hypothetical protein
MAANRRFAQESATTSVPNATKRFYLSIAAPRLFDVCDTHLRIGEDYVGKDSNSGDEMLHNGCFLGRSNGGCSGPK